MQFGSRTNRKEQNEIRQAISQAMPQSSLDVKHWWRHKNLRTLNLLLIIPLLSIFTLGFDGSMMNGLQAVEPWRAYFGDPKGSTLGLFNAAYPIGGLIAVGFVGYIPDKFGRRIGLGTGGMICCIGAALQASAQNLPMFVVARGILGAGTVFLNACGAPLITEIAHPAHRTTATALFLTSYALGSIVAGWTTFGTFRIASSASWRIPSGLQALPSVIQLVGLWFVPESPRWLISKGRNDEALAILVHYHAEGSKDDALVQFEYQEIQEALAYESVVNAGPWYQKFVRFVRTRGNRRRLFIIIWAACFSQMSGNAFISYYLSPVLTSVGLTSSMQQTLINATQQVLSWFSALYFATLPAKVGRRTLFIASLTCILICLVAITTGSATFAKNPQNKASGYVVVVFLYLFSPAYNLGLNGNLGLYMTEILTFSLRMPGLALFQLSQTCFSILSTYVTPIGLENLAWKYYLIWLPWVCIEILGVYLFFPETKGPSLEEIAVIFDGERAVTEVAANRTGSFSVGDVEKQSHLNTDADDMKQPGGATMIEYVPGKENKVVVSDTN